MNLYRKSYCTRN